MYKAKGAGCQGMFKDEGAGRQSVYKAQGTGRQGTYKAEGAGRRNKYKAEGVGRQGMNKDEGAGRQGTFKGGGAGRQDNRAPTDFYQAGTKQGDFYQYEDDSNVSTTTKLRKAGEEVITERHPQHKVKTKGKEEATGVVNRYKRPVFMDKEGQMKMEAMELKYEDGIKPVQPARYPTPHHYQERLVSGNSPEETGGGGRGRASS